MRKTSEKDYCIRRVVCDGKSSRSSAFDRDCLAGLKISVKLADVYLLSSKFRIRMVEKNLLGSI